MTATPDEVAGAVLEMLCTLQLLDGLAQHVPADGREPTRVPFDDNVRRAVAGFDQPRIREALVAALYAPADVTGAPSAAQDAPARVPGPPDAAQGHTGPLPTVLNAIRDRARELVAEHEQRAALLRRQVEDLTANLERTADESDEYSRCLAVSHDRLTAAYADVDRLRAEVERLRGLVTRLVDGIAGHCGQDHGTHGCLEALAHEARAEAGLT